MSISRCPAESAQIKAYLAIVERMAKDFFHPGRLHYQNRSQHGGPTCPTCQRQRTGTLHRKFERCLSSGLPGFVFHIVHGDSVARVRATVNLRCHHDPAAEGGGGERERGFEEEGRGDAGENLHRRYVSCTCGTRHRLFAH